MTIKKTKVQIVEVDEFFLYLPLYFAKDQGFFGFVPDKYEIEIIKSKKKTDNSAYEMLMGTSDDYSDIMFAICDPITVLNKGLKGKFKEPIILASLITNYAFWAVNHQTHKVIMLKDLGKFEKIICYEPGTTSYAVAKRIYHDANVKKPIEDFIVTVQPNSELTRFTEAKPGTVVISPDLLGIDALVGRKESYNIEFAIGTTEEYGDAVITALISRQEILNNHRELVRGVLKALQKSLLHVRRNEEDVVDLAEQTLRDGERAMGALKTANDYNVFPESIETKRSHWERAVKAISLSRNKTFSEYELCESFSMYDKVVKPYCHMAKEIFHETCIDERIVPNALQEVSTVRFWKKYIFAFVWMAISVVPFLYFKLLIQFIIIPIVIGSTEALAYYFKLHEHRPLRMIANIMVSLFIITICSFALYIKEPFFPDHIKYWYFIIIAFGTFTYTFTIFQKAYKLE
ncbi:MAG: hypothetical protein K8F52_17105 [Candidatus Scalindua rubra]|nr:hypothetical protein [Candidatus Scalindua rubra]TWU33956.1 hypothetical protein S225a_12130 [Candidatus Brocadiaceae bacterium S225]